MKFYQNCDLCNDCGQIQSKCITDPNDRYCNFEYSYTSSNSNFSRTHWTNYAKEVAQKINLQKDSFVVEIGSNDGFLAERFLTMGNNVLGVDPSNYMADLAKERNVPTLVDIFSLKASERILENYRKPQLIIANNVFNHSDNPLEFAQGVSNLLAKDGTFVFELPYWLIGLKSEHIDQIYHEHVSYFTARSSKKLLEKAGLSIDSIDVVDYHGGSLRVFAKHKGSIKQPDDLGKLIEEEDKNGAFNPDNYRKLMSNVLKKRNKFLQGVYEIKSRDEPIIGVGAAAKGNTFLNFYNLDHSTVDFVTDSSPHKQGKYTPLSRIPIVGDEIFSKYDRAYALILSWNISDQLKKILLGINPKIEFLQP